MLLSAVLVACSDINASSVATADEQTVAADSMSRNKPWVAHMVIEADDIEANEYDHYFSIDEITDSVYGVINGVSYNEESPVKRKDLRYLRVLHHDGQGHVRTGELVCHRRIAQQLLAIFKSLYQSEYPIERMVLIDNYGGDDEQSMAANNTSCYNCRNATGSRRLSRHAYGLAIDINPLYNPYVKSRDGKPIKIAPEAGAAYADRTLNHKCMIKRGDACHRLFVSKGFVWGGGWRSVKDYQHFEMKP